MNEIIYSIEALNLIREVEDELSDGQKLVLLPRATSGLAVIVETKRKRGDVIRDHITNVVGEAQLCVCLRSLIWGLSCR
jgi:hypothetical protein